MTTRRRVLVLAGGLLVVLAATVVLARGFLPFEARWRLDVLSARMAGNLREVPLTDLFRWIAPGSPVYLEAVAGNPNLHLSIKNRMTAAEDIASGKELYIRTCHQCHGEGARGESGPDLVFAVSSKSDWEFFSVARYGREGTSMPAQPVSETDIWQIHAYVRNEGLAPDPAEGAAPTPLASVNVTPQAILDADSTPNEWLTYAGNYAGHRHSALAQLSKEKAGALGLAWVAQLAQVDRDLQVSPIVVGRVMYVTQSREGVLALDATTGAKLWEYRRRIPERVPACCGMPNRGVAVLGRSVFVATIDSHLVAIDAITGRQQWTTTVADVEEGYTMTGAPLALSDRVIVGVAGGEFGARGFVAAFNAADGKLLWKFNTVPGPGEMGNDTWAGDSWKTGGAPTWTTGAYDPALDLIYWGVGNPSPEYLSSVRKGDNLFSNSVVALDRTTGKLAWHYQFTPGDDRDWDSNQQPVLADILWKGAPRQVVLWANRNGFFYALDRRTGEFLFGEAFVKQTWNEGFDAKGRPRVSAKSSPAPSGAVVAPGVSSAANWWPPSYDKARRLMFVNTVETTGLFFRSESVTYKKGELFEGGGAQNSQQQTAYMKALEADTGKVRWQTELDHDPRANWSMSGVLSTAGGVVFSGFRDAFRAFDADTGRQLWQARLGGQVRGSPISYSVDGVQYVAVAGGHSIFVFTPPRDTP